MHRNPLFRLFALWLMLCSPAVMAAGALQSTQIEAYLATLDEVQRFGERLQAAGKGRFLEREILPRSGESFDPHRRAVMALQREAAADHRELTGIVQQQGFTSPDSWALVGDRVVLAYGAIKAEAESPEILQLAQQLQGLDPQLLQLMPADQRAQMQQALVIAQALSRVPDADKHNVRPYIARLDRVFSQ